MRITDLLSKKSIALNGKPQTKEKTIESMAALMAASGRITDVKAYAAGLKSRERESTTAVGEGIAIPHCKDAAVKEPGLAAMVIRDGTDFDSADGEPVRLIFAIAAPDVKENVHLDVLSKLSVLLMDEDFSKSLINAKTADEFIRIIDAAEAARDAEEGAAAPVKCGAKILAVTGCPTGIAHTYMAAEGLQKAAEKAGCAIKIETRGSGGAKNVLTADDIAAADCVIVAADTKVPLERFGGKKVIITQVSDGISKADELIAKALKGDAPVFTADKTEENADGGADKKGIGHSIYKHLMSGVSHMLPFVIGGGILIAIAFLLDDFNTDPANFGKNLPIAAFFKTVGEAAFGLMLPVLAGYIAYSIADRPGLAVGFVGGALAASGNAVLEFKGAYTGLSGYLADTVFNSSGATVSGFLGALAAGFAAGYTVLLLKKLFSKLPESLEGIKPTLLYPVIGVFIIGTLMLFVFNPVIGLINEGLASLLHSMGTSSKMLLGLVLGAMMAIDMGGPINKAAYVFGTMAISQGNYDIMAAVMIGGMVPPIGIALATTFFKSRFTKSERQSTAANYVMGLSFITEGAIPFAAADPIHVIPATAAGAAAAGALSMVFGCTLRAPHGGIFVFPVVGNRLMYLVSLAAGAVITMLLLALLKKPVKDDR